MERSRIRRGGDMRAADIARINPTATETEAETAPEAGPVVPEIPISRTLADFATSLRYEDIPRPVLERAKHLILDAVGIALASTRWDFAHKTATALQGLGGPGPSTVFGLPLRLPLRDAVLLNGTLVHGLDYDDTHVPGIIHATASTWPCAFGLAEAHGLSGRDLLAAYIVGIETGARLGAVARGAFHQVGFHPTGLIGTYACTLLAGRLTGATPQQLRHAQGIALSTGAGSMEFLEDGAWTKRLHPGWAGVCGITNAALAKQGFQGPVLAYEGRFGLFPSHLGPALAGCDYGLATADLGEVWELEQVAVKPFPACHFAHAAADCALALHTQMQQQGLRPEEVRTITVKVPAEVIKTICEPVAKKRRPVSDYDAKFSVQFIVAAALLRGRFGLAELEPLALSDPAILSLTDKVSYEADPASLFPRAYSGEVVVTLHDDRTLQHREAVNRGAAERPLSNAEIAEKYAQTATLAVSPTHAATIREALLTLDTHETMAVLSAVLRG